MTMIDSKLLNDLAAAKGYELVTDLTDGIYAVNMYDTAAKGHLLATSPNNMVWAYEVLIGLPDANRFSKPPRDRETFTVTVSVAAEQLDRSPGRTPAEKMRSLLESCIRSETRDDAVVVSQVV